MLNDLHAFILSVLRKNYGGSLSPFDIDRAVYRASDDLFNELVEKYNDGNPLPDLLKPLKTSSSVALTAGAGTISGAAGGEVISASVDVNGTETEAFVTSDDQKWVSTDSAVLADFGVFLDQYDHLFIDRATLSLPGGTDELNLPSDFVEDLGVIYYQTGAGDLKEGKVLSYREFLNRVNSSILAPDSDNPIATIYGGKISLYPRDAGAQTFVLPYYRFPVANKPLVRVVDDGSNLDINVKPTSVSTIKIYYLQRPAKPVSAYSVASGNVTLNAPTTDINWPGAFSELANRAITYLSFSIKDGDSAQLESLVEQTSAKNNQA